MSRDVWAEINARPSTLKPFGSALSRRVRLALITEPTILPRIGVPPIEPETLRKVMGEEE